MDRVTNCRKADLVKSIEDLKLALQLVESIEDFEAKSMAYLHLFNQTRNFEFLDKAVNYASKCEQKDNMLLTIVESVAKVDRNEAERVTELIEKKYYRDKAISAIVEYCCALDLVSKVKCKKIVSSALKRLALKKKSVEIAVRIPDPYYKAIALLNLFPEFASSNVLKELKKAVKDVKNEYLRRRLEKKLQSIAHQ